MDQIGIGYIGAGGNTKLRHLPGFAEIEGVRNVAVANRSESSGRAVAEAFGIPKVSTDWRDVVADAEVDAICIGTWPYLHAEASIAALKAGKHVLTEARMAMDAEEAGQMLAVAQAHPRLVAQVVPSPFTLAYDATVQRLLKDGWLGGIRDITVEHAMDSLLDPTAPLSWRQDPQYSGKNMLTMGILHEVILRWLGVEAVSLDAPRAVFTPRRSHWETGQQVAVRLPDLLHIEGLFDNGASFSYRFSGVDSRPRQLLRLVGSAGELELDVAAGSLLRCRPGGEPEPVPVPVEERGEWRVEADFIESIREGSPVRLTSFADGVRYMKFTDAVYDRVMRNGLAGSLEE
ncbi:MAG: Gfo/Idh/MocA family oxidoreductase [Verrucomicrobia bacterium]|jgi:predicted dehydrogenase|nr:Gfo/Idh/MocA family oxidoreductase [Verrucomicrobiota bacterium]